MKKEKIISIFKTTRALLDGHFILSSGRHSPTYFQCAKVMQYPKYLSVFSKMISDYFLKFSPDLVISPAIGGIVLGTEVGSKLGCRTIFSERENGDMVLRRGFTINKSEKVLIIEDVVTTGGSVQEVINLVLKKNAKVVGVGILVDRSNGEAKLHNNQYSVVKLNAISYNERNIPDSLAIKPVKKPGSRHL